MKLITSQLHEGENPLSFSSEKDAWVQTLVNDISEQGSVLRSPMGLTLSLTKLEPDYYLKGRMVFEVEQSCSRCAESFGLKISHPIELALVHGTSGTSSQKTALTEETDQLDVTYFDGPDIDLDPLMKEQFFLSLPYQAVCKADCRGVCQSCGQNLNTKVCGCAEKVAPISAFEALKNFKPVVEKI